MSRIQSRGVVCVALVVSMLCVSAIPATGTDISIQGSDGVTTVTVDGEPLLEYHYQPSPNKLYVSQWFTPNGIQILRDSPHDHVHHHALMYAIGIEGVDFWGEGSPEKYGCQMSRAYSTKSVVDGKEKGQAVIEQRVDWAAPNQASDHSTPRK